MKNSKNINILVWTLLLSSPLEAEISQDFDELVEKMQIEFEGQARVLPPSFDHYFPYYFKFCAISRYHSKKGWGSTGSGAGHGLFYLKGACLDKSLGPAGLALCPVSADYSSSDTGVGLSVNRRLRNVNFLVFPGLTRFLGTELDEQETFTWDLKNSIIRDTLATKILAGIEFHDDAFPDLLIKEHREEFIARNAFGTDFAVALARDLFCITVPLNRLAMGAIIDHLNALNASYADSKGEDYRGRKKQDNYYHWDAFHDNCTHTPINALATLGILEPELTNQNPLVQAANIAIPAKTLLDIHESINGQERKIKDYYKDKSLRQAVVDYKWASGLDIAMLEFIPMHRNNTQYLPDDALWFLNKSKAKDLLSSPRYSYHGNGKSGLVTSLFSSYLRFDNKSRELSKLMASSDFREQLELGDKELIRILRSGLKNLEDVKGDKKYRKLAKELAKREEAYEYTQFIKLFEKIVKERRFDLKNTLTSISLAL